MIRYLVTDTRTAGRIAGRIYAWSTFGCVLGILATAWVLIGLVGVQRLVVLAGLLLMPLAFLVSEEKLAVSLRKNWRMLACAAIAGLLLMALLAFAL